MATENKQTHHLYSYFRSTCTNRAVIAMHLKARSLEFQALNPSKFVPVLVIKDYDGNETVITQSIAILEFLEESLPTLTPLLPPSGDLVQRAQVREMVNVITNDIQPITNGRIAKRVRAIRGDAKDQISFVTDVFLAGLTV
ncbi:maleylacetoacetate isomerase [Penicillium malachiteum]|uniref:maleylacetoacetate isomerase n=1 Tax=Penicillium malachiteum TaxID=1324776 RepID=UPI002546BE70|nr:maleylacetoacetate isomerase [Penicillium malachiteum]KAJ5730412.1 maleylacetoacetate isomerase [Penicillium malachiteum]